MLRKSNLATIAGMFYAGLGAIIFFGIWLFGTESVGIKTTYTMVMLVCAFVSALAVISKIYGSSKGDVRTNMLFGVFIIIVGSVILYLELMEQVAMGFYVFLASVVSGIGTYLLIRSAK